MINQMTRLSNQFENWLYAIHGRELKHIKGLNTKDLKIPEQILVKSSIFMSDKNRFQGKIIVSTT